MSSPYALKQLANLTTRSSQSFASSAERPITRPAAPRRTAPRRPPLSSSLLSLIRKGSAKRSERPKTVRPPGVKTQGRSFADTAVSFFFFGNFAPFRLQSGISLGECDGGVSEGAGDTHAGGRRSEAECLESKLQTSPKSQRTEEELLQLDSWT